MTSFVWPLFSNVSVTIIIAVLVVVGFFVVLGIAVFMCWRKRNTKGEKGKYHHYHSIYLFVYNLWSECTHWDCLRLDSSDTWFGFLTTLEEDKLSPFDSKKYFFHQCTINNYSYRQRHAGHIEIEPNERVRVCAYVRVCVSRHKARASEDLLFQDSK